MNAKSLSRLTVLGVAFALVFALGSLNAANAAPGENGGDAYNLPAGQTDLFGIDNAHNRAGVISSDADRDPSTVNSTYGLLMESQQ